MKVRQEDTNGWLQTWAASCLSEWRGLVGARISCPVNFWATFFSPLNPVFSARPVFPPSTFLFYPLNLLCSPSNLLLSPSTLSFSTLDPFFFTLLPLLGALVGWLACCIVMQTKYRQPLGKTRVVWFWLLGLLVAGWATNAKQVSTAFGENTVWLLPFLFYPTSFGWCVGWFGLLGLLVAWIWGKAHTVMDGSWTGRKCNFLVCWLLGLLAVDCLRDTVLDGHAIVSVCVLS